MSKQSAYEQACEKLGVKPATIENFLHEAEEDRKMCFGEHKFRTCIKAANLDADGKPFNPDWKDWDQWKWRVWMDANEDTTRPAGVGFSFFGGADCDYTISSVGSRLCSRSEEIAEAIGRNPEITEYFNEWMGV